MLALECPDPRARPDTAHPHAAAPARVLRAPVPATAWSVHAAAVPAGLLRPECAAAACKREGGSTARVPVLTQTVCSIGGDQAWWSGPPGSALVRCWLVLALCMRTCTLD